MRLRSFKSVVGVIPLLLVVAACNPKSPVESGAGSEATSVQRVEDRGEGTIAPTITVPDPNTQPDTGTHEAALGFDDPVGDCREAYSDVMAPCGEAVDITAYGVAVIGGTVEVTIQLDSDPMPTESEGFFVEFVVETDGIGVGCGTTNTDEAGMPTGMLHSYVYDFEASSGLDNSLCDATVEMTDMGSVVTLSLDVRGATGRSFRSQEVTISGGTARGSGSMSSADDLFNGLTVGDEFGRVVLSDLRLCDPVPADQGYFILRPDISVRYANSLETSIAAHCLNEGFFREFNQARRDGDMTAIAAMSIDLHIGTFATEDQCMELEPVVFGPNDRFWAVAVSSFLPSFVGDFETFVYTVTVNTPSREGAPATSEMQLAVTDSGFGVVTACGNPLDIPPAE